MVGCGGAAGEPENESPHHRVLLREKTRRRAPRTMGNQMRDQDVLQAATMYYVQEETMDSIAHILGTSRSTVSRLLKRARETGVVRITIQNPDRPSKIGNTLQRLFSIRPHIVTAG